MTKKKNKLPDGVTEDMLKNLVTPEDQIHGIAEPNEEVIGRGADIMPKLKKWTGDDEVDD